MNSYPPISESAASLSCSLTSLGRPRLSSGARATELPAPHAHAVAAVCTRSARMFAKHADVAERLDVVPTTFRALVIRRPRYGYRSCESAVVQAPVPAHIVEGGIPTEALISQVLVAKYADHLPL